MQASTEPSQTRTSKTWTVTERTADGQQLVHEKVSHDDYVAMVAAAVYGFTPKAARPLADVTSIAPRATRQSDVSLPIAA